jgi:hypothetical protein
MGSSVRDLIGHGQGRAKMAVIVGLAAAFMSTGTATAVNMTPTPTLVASFNHQNPQSRRIGFEPRTGGGRDAVQLGPGRTTVAGRLVPGRPSLHQLVVQ